ncbi:MAG: HNH endonuclease [Bacilli bacterium]|nr:HNH endonuclease [Bacilli bacterium]
MINNDYRYTKYELKKPNKVEKKEEFKKEIRLRYPRKNFYSIISDQNGGYKEKFLDIYDNKCVYCGNGIENLSIDLFEIDHYVNKASFEKTIDAHKLENIYPSCRTCNRNKTSIFINDKTIYFNLLNPNLGIEKVFFRDSDFSIKINNTYIQDNFITHFYNELGLNNLTRRLDYLLLLLRGLAKKYKTNSQVEMVLNNSILLLQSKRNTYTQ